MRRVSILLVLLIVIAFSGAIRVRTQAATPPILVVVNTDATNPFGGYLAEILRAEGINSFQVAQLSATTSSSLANFSLVVLAETPLTVSQVTTFSNYVAGGGRLIAMRPDSKLLPVLGLTADGTSTTEGYLSINAGSAAGAGFPVTTLPFHGTATNFIADVGATTLATLYSNQTTPVYNSLNPQSGYPAVVQSGRTVTWAYDLARSVLYTRQGDPGNAGVDRDGLQPIRTNDIFYNWIDKDRVYIPHADIQMRLFARTITDLLADTLPLPRLWDFPNAARTLFIVTADSHANPGSYFTAEVNALNARGVKGSFYMFWNSDPSPATIQAWRSQGHEFGMHPTAFQKGWTYEEAYQTNQDWFNQIGYGTPSPTVRMHQSEWLGWVDAAKVEANHGVSMDTSFMTWGPAMFYPDGHQPHGYINGSGQAMRFMDETGAIVPVWQIATSLVDEQLMIGQANGAEFTENLTTAQSLVVSRQIIDASQAGDYAAVVTNFHVDDFGEMLDVQAWELGTIDYVNSLGIPNRTAERFLAYTTARAATTMTGLSWAPVPKQLSFTATVPAGSEAQSVALPGVYGGFGLTSVTIDGAAAAVTQQTITGRVTKFVSVAAGTHALTATYTSPISVPENPPVAQPDSASTTVGVPVTISVLTNDSDPDSDPLTVTGLVQGVLGTASINANQTVTYTPAPGQCGTGTFTYNISDGRGGTASATVTVTIVCPSGAGQRTQTLATDFNLPPAGTGVIVTLVGDGEVRLAGLQGDEYSTASLNSALWTAGTWSGGALTPAITGGVLSLGNAAGAYVRSTSILPVTTVEFTARFTGANWEHIGWGDLDFGGSYLLFSTFNTTDTLFVRSALAGAEQRTSLGPIPTGFHTYRIERLTASPTTNTMRYYIDGVFQAEHTIGVVPAMYVYQSHSGGATPTLDIDRIWVYPQHVGTGNFVSPPMDSGGAATWTLASWDATVPAGAALDLRTRTSADATSWSPWSSPLTVSGQGIQSPANRYSA